MKLALVTITFLALAGCMETTTVSPTAATQTVSTSTTDFGAAMNAQRAANGRAAITQDRRLTAAAQAHAADMAANGYFSHTGRNGSTMGQRIIAQGYGNCFMAENIANGQQSEASVLAAWMGSAAHRANILDQRARSYGLGRSGTVWVMTVGGC